MLPSVFSWPLFLAKDGVCQKASLQHGLLSITLLNVSANDFVKSMLLKAQQPVTQDNGCARFELKSLGNLWYVSTLYRLENNGPLLMYQDNAIIIRLGSCKMRIHQDAESSMQYPPFPPA